MDTHSDRTDDLSPLERRLAAWQPAADGLDADAMLFAAGRASVRPGRGRFLWPALTGLLCVLLAAEGVWLAVERSERLSLARQMRKQPPASSPLPAPPAVPAESYSDDAASPDSLLTARRTYEQGLEAWPPESEGQTGTAEAPSNVRILQVRHPDGLLDP